MLPGSRARHWLTPGETSSEAWVRAQLLAALFELFNLIEKLAKLSFDLQAKLAAGGTLDFGGTFDLCAGKGWC